jgi:hypothetical protein
MIDVSYIEKNKLKIAALKMHCWFTEELYSLFFENGMLFMILYKKT